MKQSTVIFAGPSLRPDDLEHYPEYTFRGPVEEGDVLRQLETGVSRIAIIDGYFGDRRSVSHKEIIYAMSCGVRVVGAASMGALRAAELDTYGMIGLGEIFRQYRCGRRSDDGDVAVSHGPAEIGYLATSVALVDVAATCDALLIRRRLTKQISDRLSDAAQRQFFADRTWQTICDAAFDDTETAEMMCQLLKSGEVQQKRLDALKALAYLRDSKAPDIAKGVPSPPLTYTFRRDLARARGG